MESQAVAAILDKLLRKIERSSEERLPSISALCKEFSASATTVSRAAEILRQRGILEFYRGKGLTIKRRETLQPPIRPSLASLDKLKASLQESLTTGELKAGAALPKIDFIARKHHVAKATVVRAYRYLEAEGYAHRLGKKWMAGQQEPQRGIFQRIREPRIVCIVQFTEKKWSSLSGNVRISRFPLAFMEEAARNQVQVRLVTLPEGSRLPGFASSFREELLSRRDSFLGALVLSSDRIEELEEHWPFPAKKPLLLFDEKNDEDGNAAMGGKALRCYSSHRFTCNMAVEFLLEAGHRHIGYCMETSASWDEHRRNLLAAAIADSQTDSRFTPAPRYRMLFPLLDRDALERNVIRLCASRPAFHEAWQVFLHNEPDRVPRTMQAELKREYHRWPHVLPLAYIHHFSSTELYNHAPVESYDSQARLVSFTLPLLYLLTQSELTALVPGRLSQATHVHRWLHAAGLRVPEDFSLLSFDNTPPFEAFPINSLDFGFGNLGYQALHFILGDIPVRTVSGPGLKAFPHIADRGSVGLPRKGSIYLNLDPMI